MRPAVGSRRRTGGCEARRRPFPRPDAHTGRGGGRHLPCARVGGSKVSPRDRILEARAIAALPTGRCRVRRGTETPASGGEPLRQGDPAAASEARAAAGAAPTARRPRSSCPGGSGGRVTPRRGKSLPPPTPESSSAGPVRSGSRASVPVDRARCRRGYRSPTAVGVWPGVRAWPARGTRARAADPARLDVRHAEKDRRGVCPKATGTSTPRAPPRAWVVLRGCPTGGCLVRCPPGRNLGAGAEAEFGQDVLDVAVDRAR